MIGVYINPKRDEKGIVCNTLTNNLKKLNIEYKMLDNTTFGICEADKIRNIDELKNLEMVVVVGGDGTILDYCKKCAMAKIPLFGVNTGNLGFLSEISVDEIMPTLSKIKSKEYSIEKRFLLEINCCNRRFFALNEAILTRKLNNPISSVKVYVDGTLATISTGDGIMVSTPTGSTAYSLSCGGPVLAPSIDAMILNSICPHSLISRPIVVGSDCQIRFEPIGKSELYLIIDGKIVENCESLCETVVKKSDKYVSFIKFASDNFYNKLLTKMHNWAKC